MSDLPWSFNFLPQNVVWSVTTFPHPSLAATQMSVHVICWREQLDPSSTPRYLPRQALGMMAVELMIHPNTNITVDTPSPIQLTIGGIVDMTVKHTCTGNARDAKTLTSFPSSGRPGLPATSTRACAACANGRGRCGHPLPATRGARDHVSMLQLELIMRLSC